MDFQSLNTVWGVIGLLVAIILWLTFRIQRLSTIRKHFYSTGLKKDLETVVTEQDRGIQKIQEHLKAMDNQIQDIIDINRNNFQRMGFVKYSPFGEAGNLSFALVLLDDHNNGVAISSLHSSGSSRIYAKDIKKGKAVAKLTTEETDALNQAMKNGKE